MLKVNANTTESADNDGVAAPRKGIKPVLTAHVMLINIAFEPGICAKLRYRIRRENLFGIIETLYAIPNKVAKNTQKNTSMLTVNARTKEVIAAVILRTIKKV